jgi:hypothetical protein
MAARIVYGELGPDEIGVEWTDYDGDRWRFGPDGHWQYLDPDGWKNATPTAASAPFTQATAMNEAQLTAGRIKHVQDICRKAIEHDRPYETSPNHWTDRHWLAQSVLNILGGKIDDQIRAETTHAEDDSQ